MESEPGELRQASEEDQASEQAENEGADQALPVPVSAQSPSHLKLKRHWDKEKARQEKSRQAMIDRAKANRHGLLDQVLEQAVESGPNRKEHAQFAIGRALEIRRHREVFYDRSNLREDQIEDYTNSIAEEVEARFVAVELEFFEIGHLVSDAKAVRRRDFMDWLKKRFTGRSYSHLINCMRVYEVCMGRPEVLQFLKRSLWYEICSPNCPEDFRQFLLDNVAGLYPIKHRELISLIRRFRDGEINRTSPDVQGLLKQGKDIRAANFAINEMIHARSSLEKHIHKLEQLARESKAEPLLPDSESGSNHISYVEANDVLRDCVLMLTNQIKSMTVC